MVLKSILADSEINDLVRSYFSNKEYLDIDVSAFNVGACINIKCTDRYREIDYGSWNGYDQFHENDSAMRTLIAEALLIKYRSEKPDFKSRNQLRRVKSILIAEGLIHESKG